MALQAALNAVKGVVGWVGRKVGSIFADDNPVTGTPAGRVRRAARAFTGAARQGKQFVYDHAWAIDAASNMATRIGQFGNSWFGTFVHTIAVSVQGGPQASLRRCWYLALSTAFGRLRNRVAGVQACNIEAQWDVTGKACTVVIGYTNSGIVGGLQAFGGTVASSPLGPFQRGPDQVTVGGSWPAFMAAFNSSATAGGSPQVRSIGGLLLDFLNPLNGRQATGLALTEIVQRLTGNAGRAVNNNPATTGTGVLPGTFQFVFENTGLVTNTTTPEVFAKFLQSYGGVNRNLFIELPRATSGQSEFLPWSRVLPIGLTVSGPYGSMRSSNGSLMPVLPDDGRVITTGQKGDPRVQNPRPPIDGKTRGSLVSLVAQALTTPGVLPPSPPGGYVPLHGPGVFIYNPGQGLDNDGKLNGPFTEATEKGDLELPDFVPSPITPEANGFGPDGYRIRQVIPNVRE